MRNLRKPQSLAQNNIAGNVWWCENGDMVITQQGLRKKYSEYEMCFIFLYKVCFQNFLA